MVRTKLKNVRTGAVIEWDVPDEKLDQAVIDKREMQFLYLDGADYVFMDTTDYEQLHASKASLGSSAQYLKEGDSAVLQMYDDEIVGVDLPAAVELTVTETEPGIQGDRVSGSRKPALGDGVSLQVPLFVNTGDKVKVDIEPRYRTESAPERPTRRHSVLSLSSCCPERAVRRASAPFRSSTRRIPSRSRRHECSRSCRSPRTDS